MMPAVDTQLRIGDLLGDSVRITNTSLHHIHGCRDTRTGAGDTRTPLVIPSCTGWLEVGHLGRDG